MIEPPSNQHLPIYCVPAAMLGVFGPLSQAEKIGYSLPKAHEKPLKSRLLFIPAQLAADFGPGRCTLISSVPPLAAHRKLPSNLPTTKYTIHDVPEYLYPSLKDPRVQQVIPVSGVCFCCLLDKAEAKAVTPTPQSISFKHKLALIRSPFGDDGVSSSEPRQDMGGQIPGLSQPDCIGFGNSGAPSFELASGFCHVLVVLFLFRYRSLLGPHR